MDFRDPQDGVLNAAYTVSCVILHRLVVWQQNVLHSSVALLVLIEM